jgi:hypothetical protein
VGMYHEASSPKSSCFLFIRSISRTTLPLTLINKMGAYFMVETTAGERNPSNLRHSLNIING